MTFKKMVGGFAVALAVVGLAGFGSATYAQSQKQLDLAAARAQQKAVVGSNMNLSSSEAAAFWPLYDKYEAAMDKVEDRHFNEIKDFAKNYNSMTDAAAKAKLDEVMDIAQARIDVQKQYVPQFRAIISQIKTTRFFQIDNKLHALVQCQIAQFVPLVRGSGEPAPQQ